MSGPTASGPTASGPTAAEPTAAGPTAAGHTAAGPLPWKEPLRRAIQMEWVRLRTVRSTWLIIGLCLLSSGGLGLAVALDGRHHVDVELAGSVLNPGQPSPVGILLGILGVLVWGHDYRYGTIRPLLGVQPRREVLAAARLLVFSVTVTAVAIAGAVLAWVAGIAATGGDLAGYLDQSPTPRILLGTVLLGIGFGWLGLAFGALFRSLPAAVAMLFAVPALLEPFAGLLLAKAHDDWQNWLPFHALGQLILRTPLAVGPPPAVGALEFVGLVLALLALAVLSFVRRDA
jgi:ABC-2 type transport system permease protein